MVYRGGLKVIAMRITLQYPCAGLLVTSGLGLEASGVDPLFTCFVTCVRCIRKCDAF